ncbi:MAG: sulfur carrier protein ThiS [Methanobacteriaceae archaeon]|jgi:sulfur carrier protein|nr:sulfur carrier protein ThiS [Methanobacteriaceae archaeon]
MSFTLIFENKKENKELDEEISVQDVLKDLDVSIESTVVKKNGEIVEEEAIIKDGDEVQIIQIVYGG